MVSQKVGLRWLLKSGLVLLIMLLPLFYVGGSSTANLGVNKLDPLLRMLLLRNQESLEQTGSPLNLAPFAGIVGVYSDSQPILLPEGVAEEALIGLTANRVGVIIRTNSTSKVRAIGVQPQTVLGKIATARVTLAQLEQLIALPEVIHIEAARKLRPIGEPPKASLPEKPFRLAPELDVSMPETNADNLHTQGITGSGVIVGVVDTGIDYDHLDFRSDGSGEPNSRILYIWDQTSSFGSPPSGYTYGTEYTNSQIESDISNGYGPGTGQVREADIDGHGSHVAGIAAGDGSSSPSGYIGMALEADIIVVKTTFWNDDIIDGANYVFQKATAAGKPAVVNLSLGGHYGPHDGTSDFEIGMDNLLGGAGRVIVAAAGNEGDDYIHANATLSPGGYSNVTFYADPGDDLWDAYAINCWYPGSSDFSATVTSPNGYSFSKASGDFAGASSTADGGIYLDNASGGVNPNNGDKELETEILGSSYGYNNIASGTWTIRIAVPTGTLGGRFDCWFYYNQYEPFTSTNRNNDMSVGAPATANEVIAAGAYQTKYQWQSIDGSWYHFTSEVNDVGNKASFTSLGPTRDGRLKPEISAPGTAIVSTAAKESSRYTETALVVPDNEHLALQGTSMSCPHTSGGVALLFQQDPSMTASQVESQLQSDAKTDGYTGSVPNYTWGYGKLQVTQLTPPGTAAVFRVTKEGDVYADRAYYGSDFRTGGADIAEYIQVSEPVAPGDLVELDPDQPGRYRKSRKPYSTLVAGVISTAPGMIMGGREQGKTSPGLGLSLGIAGLIAAVPPQVSIGSLADNDYISQEFTLRWTIAGVLDKLESSPPLLALMGIVPVKATAENGPIRPGDLLVSSSLPGYVMRCADRPRCEGAIVGKALGALQEGSGLIKMLVMR